MAAVAIIHREEITEFIEDAALDLIGKIETAIKDERARRRGPIMSDKGSAEASGYATTSEKRGSAPDHGNNVVQRQPRGLDKDDIDDWILAQDDTTTDSYSILTPSTVD